MQIEIDWFGVFIFSFFVAIGFILYEVHQADQEEASEMRQKCSSDYSSFECQLYLHRRQYIYVGN